MLAAVTGAVDYLAVELAPASVDRSSRDGSAGGRPPDGRPPDGWLECDDLIAFPNVLDDALGAAQFGTGDDAVRASLFCQGYAFRVASVVLGPYALGLPAPDVAPSNILVRTGSFGVGAVAVHSTEIEGRDAPAIAAGLLDGHMVALIDALRHRVLIGERLLWGNVASACARVLRAVEGAPGVDRRNVRERSEAFVECATALHGVGRFVAAANSEWVWRRTTCCLWFRCEGGEYCDDCNLPSAAQQP